MHVIGIFEAKCYKLNQTKLNCDYMSQLSQYAFLKITVISLNILRIFAFHLNSKHCKDGQSFEDKMSPQDRMINKYIYIPQDRMACMVYKCDYLYV